MRQKTEDPIDQHIGNRIRQCRTRAKMSLQQASEMIGISSTQLFRYESGENRINAGSLYYLARGFSLPVSWFFDGYSLPSERKHHLENVIHEPLSPDYYPSNSTEMRKSMVALWDALPKDRQRQKVLELLETFI
ncbi:MAG: helix-turn-helix transcriptional regulator [Gammaproteobacteria bacterium]|jgi:transcriptional regulator with XRE-family HTH domain|nr:helix-turn-helix transcriptional regulator [Gammaproteobacteria bacterium]MBT7309084.1 helix-turn-helix transcriptional regulator [Gammaproteobacteria bacterium]